MRRLHGRAVTAAAVSFCALAAAAQPAGVTWSPPVPGALVQQTSVAFHGETGAVQWRAIVSKQLAGSGNGQTFYQWYLSLYAMRLGTYRLRYQSPRNGGPLSHVEQAHGAKMWFPVQEMRIVGSAQLMGFGARQLVVQSHEMAADCGSATVTIFASKPGDSAGPAATIANSCDLSAKIGSDGASIELTGPYYAPNAALCCPTKTKATATLRYRGGKWIESPNYFKIE
jgi:hypothetical protein